MTDKIERQCDTCSAYVYPTELNGILVWLPTDEETCIAGLHVVHGFADAENSIEHERRTAAPTAPIKVGDRVRIEPLGDEGVVTAVYDARLPYPVSVRLDDSAPLVPFRVDELTVLPAEPEEAQP